MKLQHSIIFLLAFIIAIGGLTTSIVSASSSIEKSAWQKSKYWILGSAVALGAILGIAGGYSAYQHRKFEKEAKRNLMGEMPEVPERRTVKIDETLLEQPTEIVEQPEEPEEIIIPTKYKNFPFKQLPPELQVETFKHEISGIDNFPDLENESLKYYNTLFNPKYYGKVSTSKEQQSILNLSRKAVLAKANEFTDEIIMTIHLNIESLNNELTHKILFDDEINKLKNYTEHLDFTNIKKTLTDMLLKISIAVDSDTELANHSWTITENLRPLVDILIKQGANANAPIPESGRTILMVLSKSWWLTDIARNLITKYKYTREININAKDNFGRTILLYAVSFAKDASFVRTLLVNYKAQVDAFNKQAILHAIRNSGADYGSWIDIERIIGTK